MEKEKNSFFLMSKNVLWWKRLLYLQKKASSGNSYDCVDLFCFLAAFFIWVKLRLLYQLPFNMSQLYAVQYFQHVIFSCHCIPLSRKKKSFLFFYILYIQFSMKCILLASQKCLCSVRHRFSKRCYNKERAVIDFSPIGCNVTLSLL